MSGTALKIIAFRIGILRHVILILNQPIDKSSAEISPFFVKLPCRATSPPAVAFLDWSYFICRLCLLND